MPPAYQSPTEASAGLTAAFQPTTPEQKAAIANAAAALVPAQPAPSSTKTTEPTVLSSANTEQKNQQNIQTVSSLPQTGQTVGATGFVHNADQSFAEAPSDATQVQDPTTGATVWQSGGLSYAIGPSGGKISSDPTIQSLYDQFSTLKSQMDATGAATIESIKNQYTQLIQQQGKTNEAQQAATYSLLARGGSLQTESSSGIIQSQVSYGLQQIADLNNKEQSAIIAAQTAMQNNDYKMLDKQLSIVSDARKEKQDAAQKINDALTKARDEMTTRNNTIDTAIRSAILDAKKGGATPDQISQMNVALTNHDYAAALTAGGTSFTDPTSNAGQYAAYVKDTQSKGLTPMTPGDFLARQKGKEAYQTAIGKAAGEAETGTGTPPAGVEPVPGASGITQAAGISLQAFNYLTQGVTSMSRMPAAQRNQIMKEANDWLNKNGVDIATFQSQYKAYNDVLQKNIMRANQTQIMAGEVSGSADSLISAIDQQDMGKMKNIRAAVIVDLLAGKEVNNPVAMKYASQIKFMANDLAGYMAAARGATSPELQDQRDAADVISNGLSKGSVQAFKDSVNANEEKVAGVVQKAVDSTQKQVWSLFGVGDKYKSKIPAPDPKVAVDTYVKSNPDKAETIAKLYEVPGTTDQDVLDYINMIPK